MFEVISMIKDRHPDYYNTVKAIEQSKDPSEATAIFLNDLLNSYHGFEYIDPFSGNTKSNGKKTKPKLVKKQDKEEAACFELNIVSYCPACKTIVVGDHDCSS